MTHHIEWKRHQERFGPGYDAATVGPYRVATIQQPLLRKGEAVRYRIGFTLPGMSINESLNSYTSVDDAKRLAEIGIQKWFANVEGARIRQPHESED